MSLPSRDKELWALALSIERAHGTEGPRVIAEKIGSFALHGDEQAVAIWQAVALRYEQLLCPRNDD